MRVARRPPLQDWLSNSVFINMVFPDKHSRGPYDGLREQYFVIGLIGSWGTAATLGIVPLYRKFSEKKRVKKVWGIPMARGSMDTSICKRMLSQAKKQRRT